MKTIPQSLMQHPDWYQLEDLVRDFIEPLRDLSTIDKTQSAEHIKAEVIARDMAYEALEDFAIASGMIRSKTLRENKPNIFK
jgi:hypothetical protein